jgi:hypothetical protein
MDFATGFNIEFASGLKGPVPYRIELTSPVGPSTEGGKQAMQHIRLVPQDGSSSMVIGSWNQVGKSVDIRTIHHLRDLHMQRFKGAPFPLDPAAYQDLVLRLRVFFMSRDHTVVMLDVATPSMAPPLAATSGSVSGTVVAAVVVAAILLASIGGALVMR